MSYIRSLSSLALKDEEEPKQSQEDDDDDNDDEEDVNDDDDDDDELMMMDFFSCLRLFAIVIRCHVGKLQGQTRDHLYSVQTYQFSAEMQNTF